MEKEKIKKEELQKGLAGKELSEDSLDEVVGGRRDLIGSYAPIQETSNVEEVYNK